MPPYKKVVKPGGLRNPSPEFAVLNCDGVSIRKQLAHIAQIQQENEALVNGGRRFNMLDNSVILGAPSYPSHLPEAEPILPGHTLIRPALGMLKSSVKFPHKEFEGGAGVYGNINNLGLKYDSRNERVMYSGFRRTPTDLIRVIPESDSSSEEETSHLRQPNRNPIRKLVKIFPAKPLIYKRPVAPPTPPRNWKHKKKHLVLNVPSITRDKNRKKRKISINAEFDKTDEELNNLPTNKRHWSNAGVNDISNPNIKRSLESKLLSSAKTLLFAKKLVQKLQSNRQRRQQDVIVIKAVPTGYLGGGLDHSVEVTDPLLVSVKPKNKLFYGKEDYNHIKINADAPDHGDYLPADFGESDSDIRNWWYYHQADFIPFDGREDD